MSKIKVRLIKRGVASVKLKPQNGIKAKTDTTYLFDPTLVAGWVDLAEDWARKTDGKVEEEGEEIDYSAKAWAVGGNGTQTNNAKYYAEQAAISESNASDSATIATNKANAAAGSASNALTYSQNAAASERNAAISETNAGNSATLASDKADIAVAKASDASDSALNAHTSEVNAEGSEERAQIWAEGDDEDVEELGGTHSSLASAALAYAYANASEDTPVEEFAANHDVVVHGEKGDKGDTGQDGADGQDGFSPSASVTQSGSVTTISITDKDGTTTASIDLSGYEIVSNKVTSISSLSTDTQYPSAKCMWDIVGDIETLLYNINSGS